MSFIEVQFHTKKEEVDKYSNYLTKIGSLAITVSEPDDIEFNEILVDSNESLNKLDNEDKLWDISKITGLFKGNLDEQLLNLQLQHLLEPFELNSLKISKLVDEDWQNSWRDQFKPITFNNKITICPSWCEPNKNTINIILDPGMAFGTGTHPTTAMCIQFLTEVNLENTNIIDYGCGSGILGLAALKLGAEKAYLTDCCQDAIDATHKNFSINGIASYNYFVSLPEDFPNIKANITIANILTNPLLELAPTLAEHTKANGIIALSGLLIRQIEQIQQAYAPYFYDFEQKTQENWAFLTAKRR